jgi:hypothetical protein
MWHVCQSVKLAGNWFTLANDQIEQSHLSYLLVDVDLKESLDKEH